MVPKPESALFKMKLDTKVYSKLLILNSGIIFLNVVPKIPFWTKLVPKLQNALLRMKIVQRGFGTKLAEENVF